MPLDTSIPLSVRPYEAPSPIQSIGSLMQLRGMGADIALKQAEQRRADQQTADIQAQADQRNRDIEATRKLQTVLADPKAHEAFGRGDFSPIWSAGISPNIANPAVTNLQEMRSKALGLQKEQSARYAEGRGLLAKTIEGLDPADDAKAADQFNTAIQTLGQEHPELAAKLQPLAAGPDFRARLKDIAAGNSVARAMFEDAAGLSKTQAEAAHLNAQAGQATAEADLARAKTPGATAESDKQRLITDAMKGAIANPQAGEQSIKDALPLDPTAAGSYISAWRAKMQTGDIQGAAEEVGKAAAHNALISQAVNPKVRAAKVADAVAVETATSPIKIHQAVQTQMQLNAGSGAALASVPPHLVPAAVTKYAESGKELSNALSQASEWQAMIDAAKGGNKVAYSFVPTTGALTINSASGTHRINVNEPKALGGAGSSLDNFEGWLMKHLTGESIPPQILDQMGALPKLLKEKATGKHAQDVQVINQSYGSKFEPVKLGDSTAGASGTIRARDPQGKLHEAPAGTPLPAGWKEEK